MNKRPAVRQLIDYLHTEGKNVTRERLDILDEVLSRKGHFSIEDIISKKSGGESPVSRATIYRTMNTFEQAGLIRSIRSIHDEKIYEIVKEHHDHMICESCGKIIEFHDPGLEALQDHICKLNHFTPTQHSMKIFGICEDCKKREQV
jgi:Fur family transcriptional regulator, ferric uptake regulator